MIRKQDHLRTRFVRAAIASALLFFGLLTAGCGEEPPSEISAIEADVALSHVVHLFLDDLAIGRDGDNIVTLYFRALDAYRENIDIVDLRGLLVEDSNKAIARDPILAELRNVESEGVTAIVILDRSRASAQDDALKQSKAAVLELIDRIDELGWDRHAFAVVAYDSERSLVVPFEASVEEARSAISELVPNPDAFDAALLDGVDFALETLRSKPENPRRTIALLVSDGRHSLEQPNDEERRRVLTPRIEAIAAASMRKEPHPPVQVYAFGHPIPNWHTDHIDLLDQISSKTSGEYLRTGKVSDLGALVLGVWDEANRSLKALVAVKMDGKQHGLSLRTGRKTSNTVVATYPKDIEIGARGVLLVLAGIVSAAFAGWVVYLRRPGKLILTGETDKRTTIKLQQGENRIGSSPENTIRLGDPSVADFHAMIVMRGRTVFVENLGSSTSTFVNGEAMKRRSLESGDRLRFGTVEARYER